MINLCYCISMLAKPSIVLLDEPSTGMDPQSKRFLWLVLMINFCFCVSMLGKPSIVLLDGPSSGMDPQSKRFLW